MTLKCEFCPREATLQCDGTLPDRTCDRSMCERCAKCVSRAHVRLSRRNKEGSRCVYWTVDLCPACVKAGRSAGSGRLFEREPEQQRLF